MIKTITNRLFLLVTMLLLSTVNALAQNVAKIGDTEYATLQAAFDAAQDGDEVILLANLTQDDGVKFDREGIAATLDLNGKTFTVNNGSNLNNRAIRIDNGTLTVNNGKIIAAGAGTTSADGTGCYGAFRVEANGKLVANDLELQNARPWGLNVKVLGGEAELTNVTINSSYGGGIEVTEADLGTQSKAGKATLTGCTFTQTNYYDHCSTPLSVSGGSELVVNSGTYRGENHVLYVFSSGGYVTVNGGQFIKNGENNKAAFIAAIDTNTYPAYTGGLKLNNGQFTGNFEITSPASTVITGGTYSVDPTEFVADGYKVVDNGSGTYTVKKVVAQIGDVEYTTLQEAFDAVANGETITLLADLTQDDGVLFDRDGIAATLDLNGKTFTVNSGSNLNSRAIRIDNGTLTVNNGKIIAAGAGTTNKNGTGCYGAFRVEANGKLVANDLELQNARPWGLNVKVLGGEAELTNVIINSSYGGGIEVTEADLGTQSKAGKATLTNCEFTQTGYFDHCSTPLSVSGGSELIVNSGTYTGENYVLYVFSSGGYITVNGGTFVGNSTEKKSYIAEIDTNTYPAYTGGLKLNAGNFTGTFQIKSPAFAVITGGTYSVDPTTFVADGYEAVANNNNTWTVGKVVTGTLTPEAGSTNAEDTAATYTVAAATVQDAEKNTLATKDPQTVKVSIVTAADDDKKVASDATISKLNMETVVAKAITPEAVAAAAAAAAADADADINVSIAVVANDETATAEVAEGTVVFDVHPEATITVNKEAISTVKLANSDLDKDAKFTFTLDVKGKFDKDATVKVVHKSDEFGDETFYPTVSADYKVSITVSHFSTFLLSEAPNFVPANISAVGFATFSSDRAVDFSEITTIHAYTATVNGNKIVFTRILKVPANTGLLLRNPNGASAVSVDVPVTDYVAQLDNDLVAVSKDKAEGELLDTEGENNEYKNYILNNVNNVVGFYRPNGQSIAKGRAYLHVLASEANAVQSFTNLFDGETTAIDSITTADEQTQDNVFYDLSGRRVNNPQRGLYIVNGKKVLVK